LAQLPPGNNREEKGGGARLRQKSNFAKQINAESTVHPFAKKYFALPVGQIISTTSRRPVPDRGALRGRHDLLARDAMDVIMSQDE
jgi:hypothetical protein